MKKHLFLLCPADYLESVIRQHFEGDHYFLTSMGNTMHFDKCALKHLAALVERERIVEITFVLSKRNDIMMDALREESKVEIKTLDMAYSRIQKHREQAMSFWPQQQKVSLVISYYLNERIKELKLKLAQYAQHQPEINGILYSRPLDRFTPIYPDLLCLKNYNLN